MQRSRKTRMVLIAAISFLLSEIQWANGISCYDCQECHGTNIKIVNCAGNQDRCQENYLWDTTNNPTATQLIPTRSCGAQEDQDSHKEHGDKCADVDPSDSFVYRVCYCYTDNCNINLLKFGKNPTTNKETTTNDASSISGFSIGHRYFAALSSCFVLKWLF
ncbi:hypothetical protein Ocin01_14718 [Orchesella cincta]|uniref:Uncharacterized protein n=1 Tax=Orchesella cincta TaxID=48709 RepID=A0A1D2MG66_ORCCI|nr:hypothetical protein Ocin01_14718 [Orchesella cincta]